MDFIHNNGSSSSASSSSNNNIIVVEEEDLYKEALIVSPVENEDGYYPLSFAPAPNYIQGNTRREKEESLQDRLNNIYYTGTTNMHTKSTHISSSLNNTSTNTTANNRSRSNSTSNNNNLSAVVTRIESTTISMMMSISKEVVINYSIHDCSSYSGSYHPQHIRVNKPTQQASRWSSGLHDHEQYITIKFDTPIVARKLCCICFSEKSIN
jgi:hypothetical protein